MWGAGEVREGEGGGEGRGCLGGTGDSTIERPSPLLRSSAGRRRVQLIHLGQAKLACVHLLKTQFGPPSPPLFTYLPLDRYRVITEAEHQLLRNDTERCDYYRLLDASPPTSPIHASAANGSSAKGGLSSGSSRPCAHIHANGSSRQHGPGGSSGRSSGPAGNAGGLQQQQQGGAPVFSSAVDARRNVDVAMQVRGAVVVLGAVVRFCGGRGHAGAGCCGGLGAVVRFGGGRGHVGGHAGAGCCGGCGA